MNSGSNHLNSDSLTSTSAVPSSAGYNGNTGDRTTAADSVLNEIVRVSGLEGQDAPDQQLQRAEFLKVAAAYQNVEFSVNPIVTALVRVALGKLSGINSAVAEKLEQFVANSICENSETHSRVRRFWDSLVKIVKETE